MTLRITHNCRHLNLVAAILVAALIAAACGGEDAPAVIDTPSDTAATTTVVEAPVREEHPCDTPQAEIEDGYCYVDAQWYIDAGAGHWVESAGPPVPTTTAEETASTVAVDETQPPADVAEAREEVIAEIVTVFEEAATGDTPSFEECRLLSNGEPSYLTSEQARACIETLAAVSEACNELGCVELGLMPPPATTTTEPPATTTITAVPTTTTEPPATTTMVHRAPTTTTEPPATTTTTPAPTTTTEPPATTTTTAAPTTTTEPPATTTTTPAPTTTTTTTTVPPASVWIAPYAGFVPEVHPDTPPPAWVRGDYEPGTHPIETPRIVGEDREVVLEWALWMGPGGYTQWLLLQMKLPLDYLGGHPYCVISEYYARVEALNALNLSYGQAEPNELRNLYGWHRCASVIDPYIVGVELPTDRTNDVGYRLSDTPGITLAERCRIVMPEDIQLEHYDAHFEAGHAGCDEWAERVLTHFLYSKYPQCYESARLATEWLEHYHNRPELYINMGC